METLSFNVSSENGLSFELLVDGNPLGKLIGSRDSEIPHWIIDDDLPYFPPFGEDRDVGRRIVTVCSCGEYGCGHAQCRVIEQDKVIEFRDFDFDVTAAGSQRVFTFSLANYKAVVAEIIRLARDYQSKERNRARP